VPFDPHAVISSQPTSIDPGSRAVWVEPSFSADICLDGNYVSACNPTLVEVLSVLDEAEELLESRREAAEQEEEREEFTPPLAFTSPRHLVRF
jgi:hypothetical protein